MGYAARFMEEAALTDSEILAFASEEGYFWLDFHRFVRGFACVDVTASGLLCAVFGCCSGVVSVGSSMVCLN